MQINQYDIWLADLNPTAGTEPGKTRPVIIMQTDLLNGNHLSTIICPITTNVKPDIKLLRVHNYNRPCFTGLSTGSWV